MIDDWGRRGMVVADKYLGFAYCTSKFRGRNFIFRGEGCNTPYFSVFLIERLFVINLKFYSLVLKLVGFLVGLFL